jgi:serine/threonine protein kinase
MTTTQIKINKYVLLEKIGEGAFGRVLKGLHEKTGQEVAVKMEKKTSPYKLLAHETTILNLLYSKHCRSIPPVYWFGEHDDCIVLIMPCYRMTLYQYIHQHLFVKQSPIVSCMKVFKSMVQIVHSIHSKYVVHCDIKPHNFMLKDSELVLIDFGFAGFYLDATGKHKQENCVKTNLMGSLPYISYFTHCGYEITRRDDLISVFYILIYMLYGELIWDNIRNIFVYDVSENSEITKNKTHIDNPYNQQVKMFKQLDNVQTYLEYATPLCGDKTVASQLINYAKYLYSLSFMEAPNYDFLLSDI